MTTAFRSQIRWCSFGAEPNPFDYMNPFKPLVHWYNTRTMNTYMTKVLKERCPSSSAITKPATISSSYPSTPSSPDPALPTKGKAVIDLAHTELQSSNPSTITNIPFATAALPQLRLFILGGHATTITYLFHLLSQPHHAHHLLTLQRGHASIFGPDPTSARRDLGFPTRETEPAPVHPRPH